MCDIVDYPYMCTSYQLQLLLSIVVDNNNSYMFYMCTSEYLRHIT